MTSMSESPTLNRRSRLKLLGMFAVGAVPVILAMLMYFGQVGVPTGRTNHGELVLPPLDAAALVGIDTSLDTENPWTLLTLSAGNCDERCQENLYKIQQVNIALGRDAKRVRHMLLVASADPAQSAPQRDEAQLRDELQLRDYPQLQVRGVSQEQVEQVFAPRAGTPAGHAVYIVDPLGNLMMRYAPEQSGNDLLDDLKKLLRVSKIG